MQSASSFYSELLESTKSMVSGVDDLIANLANVSALVSLELNKRKNGNVNWVGFYIMRNSGLVVGPFQGKPACVKIPVGKGVCGTAAATQQTQFVPDVHHFEGHIACDSGSNSEIVVPVIVGGKVVAVFDLDNLQVNGFDEEDKVGLEAITRVVETLDWNI
eukprot:TRINITY_DN3272_c0_g2_i5.p1 TRINITY_DN3272_c0_g2~~TRINITY_DN3272_c0_g2_i5.p1  ORF type:complete len:161 (+),score=32.65 TRINITY_DN3272_c0_g2_i5:623-1105(+)